MMGSNNGGNLAGSLEELSCGLQLRRLWTCRNEGPPSKGSCRGTRRVRFWGGGAYRVWGLC